MALVLIVLAIGSVVAGYVGFPEALGGGDWFAKFLEPSFAPQAHEAVAEHGLETAESWIVLAPDGAVASLCDRTRTLSLAGVAAQWAFPAADTLAGARYVAHGFLRRIAACRTR